MSKINLSDGQEIVVLDYEGASFINPAAITVGSTFTLKNHPIVPVVDECASSEDQEVEIEPNDYIEDSNSNRMVLIVGGRPKCRPR